MELTLKQRKWIKVYIETGNATEAAMRVYDCKDRDSANAIGSENLAKLSFPDLLEEMGLSDIDLVNVGIEGMQATKQISAIGDADGKSTNFVEVPDFPTRHRYWETMLKLKRRLNEKESSIKIDEAKILVMPTELIEKYDLPTDIRPSKADN